MWIVWAILLALMLLTFATRIENISIAPIFFQFDPYFDMFCTETIITYGYQVLLSPSAWPVVVEGTVLRVQPLIPYLEAYWYDLANFIGPNYTTFNTNLMSYVGSFYPPITAALLVFVVFLLLYHEYDSRIGLIGAALAAMMPVLFTTFIAGEQLLQPWGIFALFFFIACYMIAIRNPKEKRLAILAGIAFATNLLGAHYYTATAGIMAAYILLQGIINIIRGENTKDFYKVNAITLAVIIISYILYQPYQASLTERIPHLLGIPTIIAFPLFSLLLVVVSEYLSNTVLKMLGHQGSKGKHGNSVSRAAVLIVLMVLVAAIMFLTPLGDPIKAYLELSTRFTTPSKPLFMTVQEYMPTGLMFNFGVQGYGAIGSNLFGIPLLVWGVLATAIALLALSIIFRRSRTAILYMAMALPLMFAGFSEVKYLPHLGVAYIIMLCAILGEIMYLAQDRFKLIMRTEHEENLRISPAFYKENKNIVELVILIGIFFIFGIVGAILLLSYWFIRSYLSTNKINSRQATGLIILVLLLLASLSGLISSMFVLGENSTIFSALTAAYTFGTNPAQACSIMADNNNVLGSSTFCNTIPAYWLNAMKWIQSNVGPSGPRVLSWWDYGDWINWFGDSKAVLRGDNSVAAEDYATAATLALGEKYNYTPEVLAKVMNSNQSRYLLLDRDLIGKWQALDFLACIHANATTQAFAESEGAQSNKPYLLGTSKCEQENDPQYALVPLSVFISNTTQHSINDYCSISNSKNVYAKAYLVTGNSASSESVCVDLAPNSKGVLNVYDTKGVKLNAVIQSSYYLGVVSLGGAPYVEFFMIYMPDANGTIANAPSGFYTSNFYKAFMLGKLPGFTEVYPANTIKGVNLVNSTYLVRIFALDNYTGGTPPSIEKPYWVHNNYTMP